MIELIRYKNSDFNNWNDFLEKSRIDSFLFDRNFMDYHSLRFKDCSFIIYRNGKIEGLLPGNIDNNTFHSHQGLTYGGIIPSNKLTCVDVINTFKCLNECLIEAGVKEVIYKPAPYIYNSYPAQEDIYSLFILGAVKIGCYVSSTIYQDNKILFNESRKSGIRKAKKEGVMVEEADNLDEFWLLLESNLMNNYGKKPIHSLNEITELKRKFPKQIRLHVLKYNNSVVGGCVLFIMKRVVHVQYISANEAGRRLGALDLLFSELIEREYNNYPIFDFGHSNEQLGEYLNESLIFQKEGFGGRAVTYDVYKYSL